MFGVWAGVEGGRKPFWIHKESVQKDGLSWGLTLKAEIIADMHNVETAIHPNAGN